MWEYNVGGPMRYEIAGIAGAVDDVMSQQLAGLRDRLGALGAAAPAPASAPTSDVAPDKTEPQTAPEATLEEQIDALGDGE